MKTFMLAMTFVASSLVLSCSGSYLNTMQSGGGVSAAERKHTLRAFNSEQELRAYLKDLAEQQRKNGPVGGSTMYESATPAAPSATKSLSFDGASKDKTDESVTNVQHAGVDEGGIVKIHGDYLVILRRGRLFTVAIGDNALAPVSSIDAFGPDIDPRSSWYDEMLISGDTIAIIGYSYERGGTEIGLFRIAASGKLTYRATYHLRSNDYYSSRNYASRLIGSKLIFYSPLYLNYASDDPFADFPAVRKWHKGAGRGEFHRIVPATRVFRPEEPFESASGLALHTVTTCDLASDDFDCEATAVIGPPGRVFYVSPGSVYIWVTDWMRHGGKQTSDSMVYRMPLDGSDPSALRAAGSPVDQFSFLESEDGYLNVLVRSQTPGDGMWGAEVTTGDIALMRVPVAAFSHGSERVPASSYRRLPRPDGYTFQNRFVGDYLLYGCGSGWGYPQEGARGTLFAVPGAGGDVHRIPLTHGVDRIEQMGSDAVVVGAAGDDLRFSSVRLDESPQVAGEFTRKGASQGELRSHGFFYKATGEDSGMLGLPISVPGRPGYRHLYEGSVAILFLRNTSLRFHEVGELEAHPERAANDGCRASCVDWYGNARPLFVHGRIIALMGYELVEGRMSEGRMQELRRVNYAPRGFIEEGEL